MSLNEFPPEIIQRVFCFCCGSVAFTIPQPRGPSRARSGTTQVTLSIVCSRWREIALNTSALWGHVVVYYNAGSKGTWEPTITFQFVRHWLNRARLTPISLSISVYDASESEIAAITQTLSSFDITDLNLLSHNSFLLVPTNNASHIKRLGLSLYKPAWTTDVFPRLPEMPFLEELSLSLSPYGFVDLTNIYLIPWHKLRVFILSGTCWSSRALFNILQRCKSLVECSLSVESDYVDILDGISWSPILPAGFQSFENNIVLPNMEHLVLDIYSHGSVNAIIRSLTVPNLRSLDIRSWRSHTKLPLNTEAIVIMAHRSGFIHLTDFSLCLTERPVDVRSLLGSMPALERVQLYGPLMFQPGTFDNLSFGMIGLRLEEIFFGDMSDEEISLMLEAVGKRHKKAKTVSDIRPFASVICETTSRSDLESHIRQAKQCGEAFNTHVKLRVISPDAHLTGLMSDSV